MSNFSENDVPDLTGYTVVVTGVYIASRSEDRVKRAIEELSATSEKQLNLHSLQIDLLDLESVKVAAAYFNSVEEHIDLLINNAGVMNVPYKLTKDGFETQWQANYVAPHVFAVALLPRLVATAALHEDKTRVRVVNVASDLAFRGPKGINFQDVNMEKIQCAGLMELQQRYGHSKQATLRDAKEINNRYAGHGVTAYSVHPGIVKSNLQSSDSSVMGKMVLLAIRLSPTTPLQGSYNSLSP